MSEIRTIRCADKELRVIKCSAQFPIYTVADWIDEVTGRGFDRVAEQLVSAMAASAQTAPWIISSCSKDLWDQPRVESASHIEGRAFDLSPMYSEDLVIPDQQAATVAGLAWNVMSLLAIAPATDTDIFFIVEGDHLHVEPGKAPLARRGILVCAWTVTPWYNWGQTIESDSQLKGLIGTVSVFLSSPITVIGPSARTKKLLSAIYSSDQSVDPLVYLK